MKVYTVLGQQRDEDTDDLFTWPIETYTSKTAAEFLYIQLLDTLHCLGQVDYTTNEQNALLNIHKRACLPESEYFPSYAISEHSLDVSKIEGIAEKYQVAATSDLYTKFVNQYNYPHSIILFEP